MGRRAAIQNAGHADLIDLPDGNWYAVFLASRLIGGASKNLGRETFLCPVRWELDWPLFSPDTGRVENTYPFPDSLPWTEYPAEAARDDFGRPELGLDWSFWGVPYGKFYEIADSRLSLRCVPQSLAETLEPMRMEAGNPSKEHYAAFLAKRRRQPDTTVTCRMSFTPSGTESAGLAVVQAMNHQYHLQIALDNGRRVLQLLRFTSDFDVPPYFPNFKAETRRTVLKQVPWDGDSLVLQMALRGNEYLFRYGSDENALLDLCAADGAVINPEKVGCMVGEMLGVFASGNGTDSGNRAFFDWVEVK